MSRKTYPSDLRDIEWLIVPSLIPVAKTGGRPRSVDIREILNAMFYVLRTSQWLRMADVAPRFSGMADRVRLCSDMAQSGRVGADECRPP